MDESNGITLDGSGLKPDDRLRALLPEHNFTLIGSASQLNIGPAMLALVEAASAKHILFLVRLVHQSLCAAELGLRTSCAARVLIVSLGLYSAIEFMDLWHCHRRKTSS